MHTENIQQILPDYFMIHSCLFHFIFLLSMSYKPVLGVRTIFWEVGVMTM